MTKRPGGQVVGYLRVSSVDQKTIRQLDGLELDKRFTDHASGKDTRRPQLQALVNYVRDGDTIIVHSMDRLARNVDDLRGLVQDFTARGVHVRFIKENLLFTGEDSPMSNLLLSMLGAVAQFERDLIQERQREGIAIAKAKGLYKGRPAALKPDQIEEVKRRLDAGESATVIGRQYGIHRQSVYRYAGRSKKTVTNEQLTKQLIDDAQRKFEQLQTFRKVLTEHNKISVNTGQKTAAEVLGGYKKETIQ